MYKRQGLAGEIRGLLEVLDGHDAGQNRDLDAARAHLVEIAEIDVVIEEELGDRPRRAGIDLLLERIDICLLYTSRCV